MKDVTLIAGPTASGKSGLALRLARESGGVIVNADSMQVYGVLSLLTARPQADELKQAPHRLYGHRDPGEPYSTGEWLREAEEIVRTLGRERPLIFVGGTGLYFRALCEGLSPMPTVPQELREALREALTQEGPKALHSRLLELDAETARRLEPGDGQRILRALEVLQASGRSIGYWQSQKGVPVIDGSAARKVVLEPDRRELRERIALRFNAMVEEGAIDEVKQLLSLDLPPDMPAMKAIGVREIGDFLAGRLTLEEAVQLSTIATSQYAKRQSTWFRGQLGAQWRVYRCFGAGVYPE
ncbi:tRNA (adenosine(37)-N6)-dimethylallyltransferase MiaA [Nitratireductor basaltis]|uniref:tRNA dimethylallyltransferase n=1 Tax=Nitratireductor basaltis TaxID=472175 RepID=A0A084U9V0_9HYPH|nr:tRNA (adenosine(37)-N6)-dimethylallyltransferase MiaA [Nitratireductor basaltis]KFB09736.1 tRNA dimethylallyltransferase [Nitratireductor basaltis]